VRFYDAAAPTFENLARTQVMRGRSETLNPRLAGIPAWQVEGFENHLDFYRSIEGGIEVIRVRMALVISIASWSRDRSIERPFRYPGVLGGESFRRRVRSAGIGCRHLHRCGLRWGDLGHGCFSRGRRSA
jgi:hypothetical protein